VPRVELVERRAGRPLLERGVAEHLPRGFGGDDDDDDGAGKGRACGGAGACGSAGSGSCRLGAAGTVREAASARASCSRRT
jgi:hypothetical protein